MESSRIFIRGLPPTFGEADFRRHFSQRLGITDAKVFPHRRIGYVGYKSHEDALRAVKYFNRTFINMSRIAVELARPAVETSKPNDHESKTQRHTTESATRGESQEVNPLKRKRNQPQVPSSDPKLIEYLSLSGKRENDFAGEHAQGKPSGAEDNTTAHDADQKTVPVSADLSDDEYQLLNNPKKPKAPTTKDMRAHSAKAKSQSSIDHDLPARKIEEVPQQDLGMLDTVAEQGEEQPPATDADWLRSRTSRLLGLLDDEEELEAQERKEHPSEPMSDGETEEDHSAAPEVASSDALAKPLHPQTVVEEAADSDAATVQGTKRLFLRNLAYDVSEDDLRQLFATYGNVEEVHVPIDGRSGKGKGLAYIQYEDGEAAVAALKDADGATFQGRLIHVLPASAKRETKLDEYAISKLPLKKQKQIRKRAAAAGSTFSWNSLYMNADAVISSVADRLGVDKSAVLDPTSSEAAVKQAIAETHVIQETKAYFLDNGVDIEAFKRSRKGDTVILAKNFSYGTKADELRKLFEEHGQVTRLLMPPSGTIAIIEFAQAPQARSAFAALAYRKLKDSVLFLEKGPVDLFTKPAQGSAAPGPATAPPSTTDLLQDSGLEDATAVSTLFVKNLNFTTSSTRLAEVFQPLDGFMSATVKTKTNPKQPQELLSMGFGFVEFRSKSQAVAALAALNGYNLDGHQLEIRASQKGMDAAEERRRDDRAKKLAAQKSKVIIKNLPFETSKKDVRALLRQYGQLRTVRVPKKFDSTARGFAFAEFTTAKEAAAAMEALRNTHLLGRKLILQYAAEDPADAEEQLERMQQKVGQQTNKVVLQKLLGVGRQKFRAGDEVGEEQRDE